MAPTEIDITIYQGTTFRKWFQWTTGSPAVPVDLTGATARMQIRRKYNSPSPEVDLTTENGGIEITSPLTGEFEVHITAAQTSAISSKQGVYDIEIEISGDVYRLVMGNVTISKEVTRND